MGMKHRQKVYEIPKGYLHHDERQVLSVLADFTNDDRLEWAHDRAVLMPALGLDPNSDNDHRWLRRRLHDLEEAGYITRRKQRRTDKGTWNRKSIKLEFAARGGMSPAAQPTYDFLRPTPRAVDGRKAHLTQFRHVFTDEDREKAKKSQRDKSRSSTVTTSGGQEPEPRLRTRTRATAGGHKPERSADKNQSPYLDPGREDLDIAGTVDGQAVAAEPEDLEAKKREALEGLKSFADILEEGDVA